MKKILFGSLFFVLLGKIVAAQVTFFTPLAPFANSLTQMGQDSFPLRAWCYQGDGKSHILSTVTNCNGTNTANWSLVQWQAALPAATSLTDEIDWAAVQSYIDHATSQITIWVPVGKAFMNHSLMIGVNSVSFFGSGGINQPNFGINPGSQSWFHWTVSTNGIDHAIATNSKVEIHNMMMDQTFFGGGIIGINDQAANNTLLEHVLISGFNNCINLVNARGTKLEDVVCENRQAPGIDISNVGITYSGTMAFINHAHNVLMQGFALGYHYHSTNMGGEGLEDIVLSDSACGGVWKCIVVDSVNTGYGPFNYSFQNLSVDAAGQWLSLPECNNIVVTNGNWLIDPAVGAWTNNNNMIDIGSSTTACHMVRLHDLWMGNQTPATVNTLVAVEDGVNDVQISGLHIETANITTLAAFLYVLAGAVDVSERETNWYSNFAPIVTPKNGVGNTSISPSNHFQSVLNNPPPKLTNCGLGPLLQAGSTTTHGTIKENMGLPTTTCAVTFAIPLPVTPSCLFTSIPPKPDLAIQSITNTGFKFSHGPGSTTVNYSCTY